MTITGMEITTTPVDNANIVRESLSGSEMIVQHETASTAISARMRAEIETRAIIALKRPRNLEVVRQRLLEECKRPGFARAARYRKPIGKGVEGASIRFAEAALRIMGNLSADTTVTYDDQRKTILQVQVSDLETNAAIKTEVVVNKTVERSSLGRGQKPISQRVNKDGKVVYTVEATDDDVLNKMNALVSKAIRTLVLRLLPGDIHDECMALCIETAASDDAKDPAAARRKLFDAFFQVGVSADDLVAYLGHPAQRLSPAELTELRELYAAIRDGEATWAQVLANKRDLAGDEPQGAPVAGPASPAQAPVERDGRPLAERLKDRRVRPETAASAVIETSGEPAKGEG